MTEAPDGPEWAHELKYDGYRMHARLDHARVELLTRTGPDWTSKYPRIADPIVKLPAETPIWMVNYVVSARKAPRPSR